jgi:hypothetical protein
MENEPGDGDQRDGRGYQPEHAVERHCDEAPFGGLA